MTIIFPPACDGSGGGSGKGGGYYFDPKPLQLDVNWFVAAHHGGTTPDATKDIAEAARARYFGTDPKGKELAPYVADPMRMIMLTWLEPKTGLITNLQQSWLNNGWVDTFGHEGASINLGAHSYKELQDGHIIVENFDHIDTSFSEIAAAFKDSDVIMDPTTHKAILDCTKVAGHFESSDKSIAITPETKDGKCYIDLKAVKSVSGQAIKDIVTEDSPVLPYVVEAEGPDKGKVKLNIDKINAHDPLATLLAADDGIFYTKQGTDTDVRAVLDEDETTGRKKIAFRISDQKLNVTAKSVHDVIHRLKDGKPDPKNDLMFALLGSGDTQELDFQFNPVKLHETLYNHLSGSGDHAPTALLKAGKAIHLKPVELSSGPQFEIDSTAFLGFFDSFDALKVEALKHASSMLKDVTYGYVRHKPYGTQEGPLDPKLAAQYAIWKWNKDPVEGTPVTPADVNNIQNWDNKQWFAMDGFGITLVGASTRYPNWTPNNTEAPLAKNHTGQLIYYVADKKWYWSDGTKWNQHAVGEVNYFRGFFNQKSELPTDNLVANKSYAYVLTAQNPTDPATGPREIPQLYLYAQGGTGSAAWKPHFNKGALIATAGGLTDQSITSIIVKQQGKAGGKVLGKVLELTLPHITVSAETIADLQTQYPAASHAGAFGFVKDIGKPVKMAGVYVSGGTEWALIDAAVPENYRNKVGDVNSGAVMVSLANRYPAVMEAVVGQVVTEGDDGTYSTRHQHLSGFYFIKGTESDSKFANPNRADETDGFILHSLINHTSDTTTDTVWHQILYGLTSGKVWHRNKKKGRGTAEAWEALGSGVLDFYDRNGTTLVGTASQLKAGDGITFVKNTTTGMMEIGVDELDLVKDELIEMLEDVAESDIDAASAATGNKVKLNIKSGKFVEGSKVRGEGLLTDFSWVGSHNTIQMHACPGKTELEKFIQAGDNVTFVEGDEIVAEDPKNRKKLKIQVTTPKATITGQLSQGEPTDINTLKLGTGMAGSIADGVMTINSTGGGETPISPVGVGGYDATTEAGQVSYSDVRHLQFSPKFKLAEISSDTGSNVVVDLRHEGALLGIFNNQTELFEAAKVHKGDFVKGKVVGIVRKHINNIDRMHIHYIWNSNNNNPSSSEIASVGSWDITDRVPLEGFTTIQLGAGTDYPDWKPNTQSSFPASTAIGQIAYYVGDSTNPATFYVSDGTAWREACFEGFAIIAEEGGTPIPHARTLKFDGLHGIKVTTEMNTSSGVAEINISGEDVSNKIQVDGNNGTTDVSEQANHIEFDENTLKTEVVTLDTGSYVKVSAKNTGGGGTVTASAVNGVIDQSGDVTSQVLGNKLHLEMTQAKLASKLYGTTEEAKKDVLKAGVGITLEKSNDQITISGGGSISVEGWDTNDEADKVYSGVATIDFDKALTTKVANGVKVVPRLQGSIKVNDQVPSTTPFKTIQVHGDSQSGIYNADGGSLVIDSVRPIMHVETAGELERKKDSSYENRIAFAENTHTFYYLPKPKTGQQHKWETFAFHEMDQAVIDLQTRFPYAAVATSTFIEDNHMCTGYVGISLKDAEDVLHIPVPEVGTLFTVFANDATSHESKHQGHWLHTFYGMESGTEWKRHRVIKPNSNKASTEYIWSPWVRTSLLDESCYSTFMMDNDYTMQDLYISGAAASENRMVMPYCIHQDPTANIILVPNTTGDAVGQLRGKFQVRKEGLYDLTCISLPTWVDGKAVSESVSYEAGAVFQLTQMTGSTSADVISTTVKDVYDKSKKRFNPARVKFNKVKLHVGVTYEMQITLTNDTETERQALMYDPWKNLMSIDPHGSRTKTGEHIIDGLFKTMGGISFKQGNEVRIQPTSASDPTVRVFGEVYATEMKTGSKGE